MLVISTSMLMACAEDSNTASVEAVANSKSAFVEACKASLNEAKCGCMYDVYEDAGLDLVKLSNTETAAAEAQKLDAASGQKLAKCLVN